MEVVAGRATVADVESFVGRVEQVGADHDVAVQAFDARYVVDREHLDRAVALARRAFARGDAIARDPAVEILLYAAGRRQIDRALEMGISEGDVPVVAVVAAFEGVHDAPDEAGAVSALEAMLDPGDPLGAPEHDRVCEFFEIGAAERAATTAPLADLVRERVALLTVEK